VELNLGKRAILGKKRKNKPRYVKRGRGGWDTRRTVGTEPEKFWGWILGQIVNLKVHTPVSRGGGGGGVGEKVYYNKRVRERRNR